MHNPLGAKSPHSPNKSTKKVAFFHFWVQIPQTMAKKGWHYFEQALDRKRRPRLRFQRNHIAGLSWLGGEQGSVPTVVLVGKYRQLIARPIAALEEAKSLIERALDEDFGQSAEEYARYWASAWEATFSHEREEDRFTLTLPSAAVKSGIAPKEGETAAVFIYEDKMEIWRREAWYERLPRLAEDLYDLETDLSAVLGEE